MAISNYYGNEQEVSENQGTKHTVLEFYSAYDAEINRQSDRVVHRRVVDQAAYDTWHLADLFKEILYARELTRKDELTLEELPRKEKDLLLLIALAALPKLNKVSELGCSLFEMIDGLNLMQTYLRQQNCNMDVDTQAVSFHGIEISEVLRQAAYELHLDYDLKLVASVDEADQTLGLLYDRCVSSYAFDNTQELAAFINKAEFSVMNLFLSKGDSFGSRRLGKQLTYFSAQELEAALNKPIFHLFGTKAPGPVSGQDLAQGNEVLEGFFIIGDHSDVDQFMTKAHSLAPVSTYFNEKSIQPKVLSDAFKLIG